MNNLGSYEITVQRVVRPILPGPDLDMPALRYGGLGQSDTEPANPTTGSIKPCTVPELERAPQGAPIHPFPIVGNRDLGDPGTGIGHIRIRWRLYGNNFHQSRIRLNRVVDKFGKRMVRTLVSAVSHCLDCEFRRYD